MNRTLLEVMDEMLANGVEPASRENELRERFGQKCAVAAVDSAGFTRTTNERGIIHTLSKLTQMRSIMVPILKKHGCNIYVTEADSFIALFPSVGNALDAMLESIQTIRDRGVMLTPDRPYKICAGIGYGTLLVTGAHGEFFGKEMNLASKLGEDLAEADQIFLTEAAFDEISDDRKKLFSRVMATISGNDIIHFSMRR